MGIRSPSAASRERVNVLYSIPPSMRLTSPPRPRGTPCTAFTRFRASTQTGIAARPHGTLSTPSDAACSLLLARSTHALSRPSRPARPPKSCADETTTARLHFARGHPVLRPYFAGGAICSSVVHHKRSIQQTAVVALAAPEGSGVIAMRSHFETSQYRTGSACVHQTVDVIRGRLQQKRFAGHCNKFERPMKIETADALRIAIDLESTVVLNISITVRMSIS